MMAAGLKEGPRAMLKYAVNPKRETGERAKASKSSTSSKRIRDRRERK